MAAEWVANHDEPDFWLPELERFHRLVPSGHIVEIGPGHGREAAWFIDKGYTYTGVEPSIEMLLYAQDNNRAGNFVHTTVAGFHAESKTFDGFWAAASLLHIPKRDIEGVVRKLCRVSRGPGFIALKDGPEGVDGETWYGERFVAHYRRGEFEKVLHEAGTFPLLYDNRQPGWHTWIVRPTSMTFDEAAAKIKAEYGDALKELGER
jgi:hypothetical protein